jgi:hypothetical protein
VSTLDFTLSGEKNAMEALRMLKVAVGRWEGTGENTDFFCGVHCAENAESLGCPTTVKQIKLWIE